MARYKTILIAGLATCSMLPVRLLADVPHALKLGAKAPHQATVLIGKGAPMVWVNLSDAKPATWTFANGEATVKVGNGNILTVQKFKAFHLHVEFKEPLMPDKTSQGRGNSGVYLHGRYEIQVLDSYHNPTYAKGGVGAIYGVKDPDVDAIRPPEVWQWYDIFFVGPEVDSSGTVTSRPRVTVFHNGLRIHNNVEIPVDNTTAGNSGAVPTDGPIMLQDHGAPVVFRNVWIEPLATKTLG